MFPKINRLSVMLLASLLPISLSGLSTARATVTGSMTVTNGTSSLSPVPGTIKFNKCQSNHDNYISCSLPSTVATGSSTTGTVTNTHDVASTVYGSTDVYITYYPTGDNPGVIQTPNCVWQVNVSSNAYAFWTGTVSTYATIDAGYGPSGYTPTCSYSGFTVNGTTGNWTLTIDWAH